ncbi:MAG: hypothetical protein ACI4WS_06645 [Oscillospiraceae bacterium]
MKRYLPIAAALPLFLCSCGGNTDSLPAVMTTEAAEYWVSDEQDITFEDFAETMEHLPAEHELSAADPLEPLDIQPSGYFKPGVWLSEFSEDTGNFYIFNEDGVTGRFIPISDAEGVDFTYSIDGSSMTMYVGEELTPYSAELETIDEGHVMIHMTFLGTQDDLTYMMELPDGGFTFYPARKLADLAKEYYKQQTGVEPVGVDYTMYTDEYVVLEPYVRDANGYRSYVESYTVSLFTAKGWSGISIEDIDLSGVVIPASDEAGLTGDDIPDAVSPTDESFAQQ